MGEQVSHRYLFFAYGKNTYIVRGKGETREGKEIIAEARTKVVVPRFGPQGN